MRCWLGTDVRGFCSSVCLSRSLNLRQCVQCMPYAVCEGSFSAAFAKCLWPLVRCVAVFSWKCLFIFLHAWVSIKHYIYRSAHYVIAVELPARKCWYRTQWVYNKVDGWWQWKWWGEFVSYCGFRWLLEVIFLWLELFLHCREASTGEWTGSGELEIYESVAGSSLGCHWVRAV